MFFSNTNWVQPLSALAWRYGNSFYRAIWLFLQLNGSGARTRLKDSEILSNVGEPILLEPQNGTNFLFRPSDKGFAEGYPGFPGPNLTDFAEQWLREKFLVEPQRIRELSRVKLLASPGQAVFALVGTTVSRGRVIYTFKLFWVALYMRRRKIKVYCLMPDTYYPDGAIFASILAGLSRGATIFLQSSKREAMNYGYRRAIAPVFWTWPESRLGAYSAHRKPWEDRSESWICPSNSSEPLRRSAVERVRKLFETSQYLEKTSGNLLFEKYLQVLGETKIVMTTNYLQSFFVKGPRAYKARLARTTTTGRVWEAFASGCALVCNPTEVLEELGFVAGVHYVDFELLTGMNGTSSLPSDLDFQRMARAGSEHFESVVRALR